MPGEMPEWSNGAVSKTVVRSAYRGFESPSLRNTKNHVQNVVFYLERPGSSPLGSGK